MNRNNAFYPAWNKAVTLTTAVTTSNTEVGLGNRVIVVTNQDGTDGVYVSAGDSSVTASTADYYLPPNGQVALTKDQRFTHVAAIAVANTPAIHIMPGEGM